MSIIRAEVIQRMTQAFKQGLSASKFVREMKTLGLSYRKTTMLSDWRSVNQIKVKEGLARFVRKDRIPTKKVIAEVAWNLSQEYLTKVKVWFKEDVTGSAITRFVNLLSDRPMTPADAIAKVKQMWTNFEQYGLSYITKAVVWSIARKIA